MNDPCRIYVADLAAYNSGRLRGEWIDLAGKDESDVWNAINAMLARSPESNVERRICPDCGRYQTRSYHGEAVGACDGCGADLSGAAWFPSAEEWAVHDHEGFAGMIKSEWPDIGELVDLATFLDSASDETRRGLLWLVNDRGFSVADAMERADEVCTYQSDSFDMAADYAQELFDETHSLTDSNIMNRWPFTCIDWKDAAKELQIGGDIDETTQEGVRFIVTNASDF